jgi:hypothetical protein
MPVDLDDGAADERVLEIGDSREIPEYPLENAFLGPSSEALPHRSQFAELRRQIAPRRAGLHDPQHDFEKRPIVLTGAAGMAVLTRKDGRNPRPLLVAQSRTPQDYSLSCSLESNSTHLGRLVPDTNH